MLFKKEFKEQPLNYWEEKSVILAIPPKDDKDFIKGIFERVSKIKEIEVLDTKPIEINKPGLIKISYQKKEYDVELFVNKFTIPVTYINKAFYFTEEEINNIKNSDMALSIFIKFKDNPTEEFKMQLKLALAMVPNLVGVVDESAEKLLPAKWVKLNAEAKTEISSTALYNIQAIYDKNEVWLHTHGLNRFGITELEILGSNKENYNNHYHLINTYASYLIDNKEKKLNPREKSSYIGVLINRQPIVVTCLSWTKALNYYKRIKVGNIKDREKSHNGNTSVIFIYKTEKDEQNKKVSKVTEYNNLYGDNPIFFISDKETKRMKELARERFNYVIEESKNKDSQILIKIGLKVAKEFGNFEHIWFELLEVKDNKFKAKLTQEPYNVENIHEGHIDWYTVNDVTDWMIFKKDKTITPKNVYILMK